jgi:hypothetical protein
MGEMKDAISAIYHGRKKPRVNQALELGSPSMQMLQRIIEASD